MKLPGATRSRASKSTGTTPLCEVVEARNPPPRPDADVAARLDTLEGGGDERSIRRRHPARAP